MTEYVSQLETLLPCKELLFSSTPGFGDYKPFLSQATAHPAKMNTTLVKYLIELLTKEGDVILDPMSGSGGTGVISALLGRDAVCVELEEKFHGWQLQAKEKVRDAPMLTRKGSLTCIKGDARNLSELLQAADAVITSPPYSNLPVISYDGAEWTKYFQEQLKTQGFIEWQGKRYSEEEWRALNHGRIDGRTMKGMKKGSIGYSEVDVIVTSPPYVDTQHFQDLKFMEKISKEQGEKSRDCVNKGHFKSEEAGLRSWGKMSEGKLENSDNIGNLSQLGEINVIITSPPYEESLGSKHHSPRADKISEEKSLCTTYTEAKKVDVVITSPPYSEGIGHGHAGENASHEHEARLKMQERYASAFESKGNIASLKHGEVTAVITSPPFGEDVAPHTSFRPGHNQNSRGYTDSKSEKTNIGNLKKETYLTDIETLLVTLASKSCNTIKEVYTKWFTIKNLTNDITINSLMNSEKKAENGQKLIEKGILAQIVENHVQLQPNDVEGVLIYNGKAFTYRYLKKQRKKSVNQIKKLGEQQENMYLHPIEADLSPSLAVLTPLSGKVGIQHGKVTDSMLQEPEYLTSLVLNANYAELKQNPLILTTLYQLEKAVKIPKTTLLFYAVNAIVQLETNLTQEAFQNSMPCQKYLASAAQLCQFFKPQKPTYLSEMLTVYHEMFKVLKPGGSAAIVVKPFIRNRVVIDLPYQTLLLMQTCGFKLTRLFKLRLEQQSFWRILYMKKNPLVPQIWHEYILVCEKPSFNLSGFNTTTEENKNV